LHTLRTILARVLLFLCFAGAPLWAVDPSRQISQYAHSSWFLRDGVVTGLPRVFAQTRDGYLWVGTTAGLFRSDGIRFLPWSPSHEQLPSTRINSLLGATDGSLWIGTAVGLSHWKDNHLTNLAVHGIVPSITQARDGTIWFVLDDSAGIAGRLCQVSQTAIRCHGKEEGIPELNYTPVVEDSQGNLWLGGDNATVRWQPGSKASKLEKYGMGSFAAGPDGSLWALFTGHGGLQRLTGDAWKPFLAPEWNGYDGRESGLLLDRENALWVPTDRHGIYRIYDGKVDHFGSADGLSSDSPSSFFEDHEGNLWVATTKGIDCFRNLRVASFSTHEGVTAEEVDSILAIQDGSVLIGGAGLLDVLQRDRFATFQKGEDLSKVQVTSLFEDKAGRLWIGLDDTLSVYQQGRFRRINGLGGGPTGMIVGITEDIDGDLWVEAKRKTMTLLRIRDFKVQQEFPAPDMPAARRVAADPEGGIWLGLINGDLARYQHGQIEIFHFQHKPDSRVEQVMVNSDGSVLGATAFGLIGWRQGKQAILTVRNGLPCNSIFGTIFDDRGSLWLYTECGLLEIAGAELQKWWDNSEAVVQPRVFGVVDGVQPGRPPFSTAARSTDGRLWFTNGILVQMIDPAHQAENSVPPPISVEGIVADRRSYSVLDALRLPPRTRDLEIDYSARSFVAPQKVSFRYQLEGRDTDWQEAGTRRQAFYSDLRPGTYRFRVIACNNDGVWNEQGATLNFSVAPAWFQTNWFLLLCVIGTSSVVWGIYRMRVRQVARAMSARFDERLAERTRIARELHDTFLQTLQGSKLVAEDALEKPSDSAQMRRAMERLSVWLEQAVHEGRAALNSLRASTTQKNDLAEAFKRATQESRMQSPMEVSFSVAGDSQEMHPLVRDEIYRIGYEAIRNAYTHSKGNRLEVGLRYGEDLSLCVRDNGIGVDPAVASQGRDGHFGLQGMRERAARIGGKLTVVSSPESGTQITVVVPGGIVFQQPNTSALHKIKRLLRRTHRTSPID